MADKIRNIVIDINDIPNLQTNAEVHTLVTEAANEVRAVLTEPQAAGELFLQALNDIDLYLADGTLNEDFAIDDLDHMNEYDRAEYLWCYLACNLREFASTEEGKQLLEDLSINLIWDL